MANLLKSSIPLITRRARSALLTSARSESNRISSNLHNVNNLEKRFLVWTKKYKSVEEVPNVLPVEVVDKARNRMRIRIANWMMAATLVACVFVSMSGKRMRDKGDTLTKRNLDWHAKMNEEFARQEAEDQKTKQGGN